MHCVALCCVVLHVLRTAEDYKHFPLGGVGTSERWCVHLLVDLISRDLLCNIVLTASMIARKWICCDICRYDFEASTKYWALAPSRADDPRDPYGSQHASSKALVQLRRVSRPQAGTRVGAERSSSAL